MLTLDLSLRDVKACEIIKENCSQYKHLLQYSFQDIPDKYIYDNFYSLFAPYLGQPLQFNKPLHRFNGDGVQTYNSVEGRWVNGMPVDYGLPLDVLVK